jgi:hypothetical protein
MLRERLRRREPVGKILRSAASLINANGAQLGVASGRSFF